MAEVEHKHESEHDHPHEGAPRHQHGPECDHEHDHDHDHGAVDAHPPEHDHDHEHDHEHDHHHDHHHDDHDHGSDRRVERPVGVRPAENGGLACQLDLGNVIPGETDEFGRTEKLEQILEAKPGILDMHLRQDLGYPELCVHYDEKQVTLSQVVALMRAAGAEVSSRYFQKTWFVRGMDSAQCAYVIEYVLRRMKGVLTANVAYAAERLVIEYDGQAASLRQVEARIRAMGYELEEPEPGHACSHHAHSGGLAPKLEMPLVIASGVLIGLGFLTGFLMGTDSVVPDVLFALALVAGGYFPLRGAINSLRQRILDIETLMILAGVGAGLLGAWFEGAFLLFLFSLGHALEHRAMDRARRSIETLGQLRPTVARVKRGEVVQEISVHEVQRGQLIVVRPGDRVPLDGVIRQGQSSLDQAVITGESTPVAKGPDDTVYAGTINTEAVLEVEVTKLSTESVMARIVDLVTEAEAQKSPSQRFAKRVERQFVPVVLITAPTLTVVLMLLGTGFLDAVLRGISLLVAASPCALAISTPAAVLSAVARAARGGVLIKGGAHLESLGQVAAIAFDKTGTLTIGKPRLLTVSPAPGIAESELLLTAASAESVSSHPIAHAVVTGAQERGIKATAPESCQIVHGKGLQAVINGEAVAVGNLALFDGEMLPPNIAETVKQLEVAGQTAMVVKRGDSFLGALGVADRLRAESKETLAALKELGIGRTIMLSGDNNRVARAIGAEVGIDEARAPLMPDGKVAALRDLAKDGGVAMVGDGVNDAPALAAASVGVAMGGAGSDVALETADVVLMSDDLSRLPFAVKLARTANGVVRQNLVIALGVSAILIVASIFGWVGIGQAVIFHEGSTLLVVANGLRLLGFRG